MAATPRTGTADADRKGHRRDPRRCARRRDPGAPPPGDGARPMPTAKEGTSGRACDQDGVKGCLSPTLPSSRVPPRVHARQQHNLLFRHLVDETIGKPADRCPAGLPMNLAKPKWIFRDRGDALVNAAEEVRAQTTPLALVPGGGFGDFDFELRAKGGSTCHANRR
jgi:hypothetical protein